MAYFFSKLPWARMSSVLTLSSWLSSTSQTMTATSANASFCPQWYLMEIRVLRLRGTKKMVAGVGVKILGIQLKTTASRKCSYKKEWKWNHWFIQCCESTTCVYNAIAGCSHITITCHTRLSKFVCKTDEGIIIFPERVQIAASRVMYPVPVTSCECDSLSGTFDTMLHNILINLQIAYTKHVDK